MSDDVLHVRTFNIIRSYTASYPLEGTQPRFALFLDFLIVDGCWEEVQHNRSGGALFSVPTRSVSNHKVDMAHG